MHKKCPNKENAEKQNKTQFSIFKYHDALILQEIPNKTKYTDVSPETFLKK